MTDYIKREDAINAVANNYWNGTECECYAFAHKALDGIQSADAAPVRHGRWIVGEQMPMHDIQGILSWGNWYTCNQCEFKTNAIEGHITQYHYCPNCGAKMDEGE